MTGPHGNRTARFSSDIYAIISIKVDKLLKKTSAASK